MNSKEKGNRFERWFAHYGQDHGLDSHRGQQFKGGIDTPDVTGFPGLHIEAKHNERLNVHDAMQQAIRDSEGKAKPTVVWKKNRKPYLQNVPTHTHITGPACITVTLTAPLT